MQTELKICFIGGGNMAAALIGGLAGKLTAGANIHVVDINAEALARLAQRISVTTAEAIDARVAAADVIVLARYYIAGRHIDMVRRHAPRALLVFDTLDLHVLRSRRLAHDPPMLRERLGVPGRPELVQKPRRALDVGEQERHRALG